MTNARVDRQRTTQLTSRRFDAGARGRGDGDPGARGPSPSWPSRAIPRASRPPRRSRCAISGRTTSWSCRSAAETLAAGNEERLWRAFHEAHEARFGFSTPGEIIEIVNFTATVVSRTAKPEPLRLAAATGDAEPIGTADGPLPRRDA